MFSARSLGQYVFHLLRRPSKGSVCIPQLHHGKKVTAPRRDGSEFIKQKVLLTDLSDCLFPV